MNCWYQLEVAANPRQIQGKQIIIILYAGPASELFESNHAIGPHIQMMNGECGVFINELAQHPISTSPKKEQGRKHCAGNRQGHSQSSQANAPPLRRAQFYV